MLYKRGKFWWYEFQIDGRKIRQSTKTEDRILAEQIAEARHSQALLSPHGGYSQFITLAEGAELWYSERRAGWTRSTELAARYNLRHLVAFFGSMKLHRITPLAIGKYQSTRLVEGASAATINQETTTLRSILRKARLWEDLRPDVKRLRQRTDVGRALEELELRRLLAAARTCPSESLYTAILLSVHTGLRRFELCNLQWRDIDRRKHTLRVMRSKTEAGTGRIVPLNSTAWTALDSWRAQFSGVQPEHYIFPTESYGFGGRYRFDVTRPITGWNTAWSGIRKKTGVQCRWHDLRHTFISRLAERPVSDSTIKALAGHVSPRMLARYSHVRNAVLHAAVRSLDKPLNAASQ